MTTVIAFLIGFFGGMTLMALMFISKEKDNEHTN